MVIGFLQSRIERERELLCEGEHKPGIFWGISAEGDGSGSERDDAGEREQ